jgi:EPS-associated MarR family transcriptional regulator
MDENHLKTLRILELEPSLSQRGLAQRLDMSLGKANYLLNSMITEGYVRAVRFKNARNKRAYMYYLTPEGFKHKLDLSFQFLQVKAREFELLQKEIEILKQEVMNSPSAAPAFSGVPPVPFNE